MYQAAEILIPMSFFASVLGLFFMRSRENMALIEKGINPRKNYGGPKPYAYMKYALLFIGAGLGLFIAYMIDVTYLGELTKIVRANGTVRYGENPAIYFALLAIGGGIGLFSAYKVEKKNMVDKPTEE